METNVIYNEDCLNILKTIPNESIDLVATDCPYRIIAGGVRIINGNDECGGILNKRDYLKTNQKGCLNRGRIVYDDNSIGKKWQKKDSLSTPCAVKDGKMFNYNEIKFNEWLPEIYRVLKKGTHCYIMINGRNLKDLQIEADSVGFEYQNLLIWKKGNTATPNKYYMQQCEFILMLSKRPARNINNMGTKNLFDIPNIIGNKDHPTQKPVSLMEILISNSTKENEIVLDPFMGTGATIMASKNLNRQYIGIELDKQYFDIVNNKLNYKEKQIELF